MACTIFLYVVRLCAQHFYIYVYNISLLRESPSYTLYFFRTFIIVYYFNRILIQSTLHIENNDKRAGFTGILYTLFSFLFSCIIIGGKTYNVQKTLVTIWKCGSWRKIKRTESVQRRTEKRRTYRKSLQLIDS